MDIVQLVISACHARGMTPSIQNPARPKLREVTYTQPYCHASLARSMTWSVALAMPLPAQGLAKRTRAQWMHVHSCVGGFQTRALLVPSSAGFNPARFRRILLTS